jgi:DNA-cytosine methyltransferase
MNILSLFDGISCGQVALNRAGIKIDKYYASEINKSAITITQHNFPNTIQLGDVTKININNLPTIDLLLAGSPCQSLSNAGKREGFSGKSKLFFEFVRILKELKPKYFLLENVKMKKEWQDIISKEVGVSPVKINSCMFSAQKRERLYWTNIPIDLFTMIKNQPPKLKDILEIYGFEKYIVNDSPFVKISNDNGNGNKAGYYRQDSQANRVYYPSGQAITLCGDAGGGAAKMGQYMFDKYVRKLMPVECERLQTLPDGYTNVDGISEAQRYKALGNGWTVDVIVHILRGIV